MKKIIALALALVLVASCTFALAEDINMTNEVSTEYLSPTFVEKQKDYSSEIKGATQVGQHTNVWLQVEASGQIDVTIPLVAVFKTNIDGGKDTISENYEMINNSSADIAVTLVRVKDNEANVSTNGDGRKMELIKEADMESNKEYNKYSLSILPDDQYQTPEWVEAKDVGEFDIVDGYYTLDSGAQPGDEQKGLWLIEKKDPNAEEGTASYVELVLNTSRLSFVTNKTDKGEEDIQDGVCIFTVFYTVKIDDSSKVGKDVKGTTIGSVYKELHDAPETHTFEYKYSVTEGLITDDQDDPHN